MTTHDNSDRLSTAELASAAEERRQAQDEAHDTQATGTTGTAVQYEAAPVDRQAQDRPAEEHTPLFAGNDAEQFRGRWSTIQASFVDEPRSAVEQADALVAEVMQRLAQVFADERKQLEQAWDRGGETDTEQLRQALRRYRSFFDRLLTM